MNNVALHVLVHCTTSHMIHVLFACSIHRCDIHVRDTCTMEHNIHMYTVHYVHVHLVSHDMKFEFNGLKPSLYSNPGSQMHLYPIGVILQNPP